MPYAPSAPADSGTDTANRAPWGRWRSALMDPPSFTAEELQAQMKPVGVNRVHFQWQHGPAPYVLHAHFDILPTDLPAEVGDRCFPDAADAVCTPEELVCPAE